MATYAIVSERGHWTTRGVLATIEREVDVESPAEAEALERDHGRRAVVMLAGCGGRGDSVLVDDDGQARPAPAALVAERDAGRLTGCRI